MIAIYSMTNKDIAIYSKNGNLLLYTKELTNLDFIESGTESEG